MHERIGRGQAITIHEAIDLVKRLFDDGYEGEDLHWAIDDECRTLNFSKVVEKD